MIRRPTISTRTDTPFPYTTLFRSGCETAVRRDARNQGVPEQRSFPLAEAAHPAPREEQIRPYAGGLADHAAQPEAVAAFGEQMRLGRDPTRAHRRAQFDRRSAERRVGKEVVSTFSSRWSPAHLKKKQHQNTPQQ